MAKWFFYKFRLNFHWQITALIAGGIIAFAIIASLSAGWILNQSMTELLKQQGLQITKNLAHQSILPLLSGASSSASSDVDSILTFTHVKSATIYTSSGKVLFSSESENKKTSFINDVRLNTPFLPVLFVEEKNYWIFKSSVYDVDVFDQDSESIDSLFAQAPKLIGFVSITVDRRSIYNIQQSLIVDNLWISSGVAFILILFGFWLVKKLIKPLYELAKKMKRAEEGAYGIRADLAGSKEILHMGKAFNTMMIALEYRREYAEKQRKELVKEVDERKAAEKALRSSEIHFRTVFESVVDGILIANESGVIESANPAAIRFINKPLEKIVKRCISEVLLSFDMEDKQSNYSLSEVNGSVFIYSVKHNNKQLDLSLKFSEMVINNENKQIVILHDITENQKQKKRIESLLSQHEAIVSSIPGIIIELDQEGRFTWWNSRTEEVTGCDKQQLRGRVLADFIDENKEGEINAIVKKSFINGKVELHANMVTPQGIVPYQFNGLIIPSPSLNEKRSTLLAVGMDDSESIKTQVALQKARDIALETARVKSEFLANMSHEIRTPMNGMMGMLQLIEDSDLNDEQQGYINIALRSSDQLLSIINDILDFSKMEAGKMDVLSVEYSPRTLIEEAVELFTKKAHEKGLKIYSRVSLDIPSVSLGDAQRITQVLSNLIGNAIKFTDLGYVMIDVSLIKASMEGPVMKVSVIDTGIGIDSDMQMKIFESFAQIDGSSTRKYSGTGLGLAIVKQLVGLMGGEVSLNSEFDKGSDFNFTLPVKTVGSEKSNNRVLDIGDVFYVGNDKTQFSIINQYLNMTTGKLCFSNEENMKDNSAYLVEQDSVDEFVALYKISNVKTPRVILLTNYQNYYDIKKFPLKIPIAKLSTPIRFNALHNVFEDTGVDKKTEKIKRTEKVGSSDNVILIVEDNKTNRYVIVSMLNKLGYQVDLASNGKEAVEKISEYDYSLVFMDCQMPVMDGYEATGRIRDMNKKESKEVVIVAMTGNVMEGEKEKCLVAGMNAYMAKPVRLATLKEMLKTWVK